MTDYEMMLIGTGITPDPALIEQARRREADRQRMMEFDLHMQNFHFAMQLACMNLGGLAMGAAFNPDPKAAAACLAGIQDRTLFNEARKILDRCKASLNDAAEKPAR